MTKARRPSNRPSQQGFATRRRGSFPWKRVLRVGVVMLPLALFSGAYSAAVSLDTRQPEVSQQLYSDLPLAKVRLGDLALAEAFVDIVGTEAGTEGDTGTAGAASRQAPLSAAQLAERLPDQTRAVLQSRALSGLSDTPYSSGALRQLAFIEREPERRRVLLDLSRQVSRRDVSAAAQVAELQLLSGSLDEGLATLDQALVISDALDDRIFPLLLNASRLPEFEDVLRRAIARDPEWAERFARHASANAGSAPLFAQIVDGFPESSRARSLDYGSQIVDRLAVALQPQAAFAAYEAYSDSPQDINAFGTRPLAPLDWRLIDNLDVGTRMLGSGEPVVELFASARRSGDAARIMTRLQPGSYALGFALMDARGVGGMLTLTRVCIAEGREVSAVQTSVPLAGELATVKFDVPRNCAYQSLRLGIDAEREAVSVLLSEVTFERLSQTPSAATP